MEALENKNTRAILMSMPVFIRLVFIPMGLLVAYSSPGLWGSFAALIIAYFLKKEGLLTKTGLALVGVGVFILPAYLLLNGNYIISTIILCLLFSLSGGLALAPLWKMKPWNIRIISTTLVFYLLLVCANLWIQRFPWVPYPAWCERTIVKSYDYRIMQKFFGKTIPDTLKITQVYFQPYSFPSPDGPLPVQYEVHITANGYQELINGLQMHQPKDDERDYYLRRLFSSKEFHNDLYDEYEKSFDDHANYHPPTIYLGGNDGWFYLDERTSPSLRLFIATRLPYQGER